MKVFHKDKWIEFYPIIRPVIGVEKLDNRPLEELEDEVFGKGIFALVAHQPVWIYLTVKKKDIRAD